jgi:hypothetical protein
MNTRDVFGIPGLDPEREPKPFPERKARSSGPAAEQPQEDNGPTADDSQKEE